MRKKLSKELRQQVYNKFDGHCAYCGCQIEYKDMQVDHLNSVYVSELHNEDVDESIDNLMPACRMCNFYKGANDIETFRNNLTGVLMHNLRKSFDYRLASRYGLVEEHITPVEFYFEKFYKQ